VSRLEPRVLDAPPAGWDALVASDPGACAAHRPELWSAFARTLPGLEPRFIAATGGRALEGGAPVLLERRAGLHWIHALPYLLSGAPLAAPGSHAAVDAAVGEGIGALQRAHRAVGGEWALYRPAGPAVDPEALVAAGGETRALEAALVELDRGLEPALRRMERKTRQAARQARDRGLRFAEDPGALGEAWALHLMQSRRWAGHRPPPTELSRRLLGADAAGEPLARLFTVTDARGLLAATLALDHPRELTLWWSGTHPEGRGRHAFTLLLVGAVEWAAAHGRARVNLGASAGRAPVAAFKASLGARMLRYPVRWLDARHASAPGRLVAAAQAFARRGRPRGEAA
jgi:hypothetical protein